MKIRKEFKIGVIVILSIGLFIYGFNFLRGKNIFKKETKIFALYEKNDGLMEASPLLVNGYKVGQINRLDLIKVKCRDSSVVKDSALVRNKYQSTNYYKYFMTEKYKVLVTFNLNESVNIPKNSIARIVSQDLLGTKAVSVELGDFPAMVVNGDTLQTAIQENLSEGVRKELQPLKNKIEGLVGAMDSVVGIVTQIMNADVRKNLIESFESIKNAVIALDHSTHVLDTMVTKEQSKIAAILNNINSITKNLESNNEKITHVIDNFSNISDSLAQSNVKQTIENTNHALS
ncbi:MAG: hypothetical protein IAF38_10740, partial [Bacteroidia bacterium]|nr:hypothetical protein [Bacteroidia bacterium]